MNTREQILLVLFAANFAVALLYLIWGTLIRPRLGKKETFDGRVKYAIMFVVMVLCPGIGPLFFAAGYLLFRIFLNQKVDLAYVTFSKERMPEREKEDLEAKLNIAPIEDAVAVGGREQLRSLMMNVIKGDVHKSLAAIALALNSEDSEASHYAASVLCDELDEFRGNVQKFYEQIQQSDENQLEYCVFLIGYMNEVLAQKVFIQMEQEQYVHQMAEVGEVLFEKDRDNMQSSFFEWIFLRLLEIRDFARAEKWSQRLVQIYPHILSAYTCRLKLYFSMNDREAFFQVLEELKSSSVVIDSETLELIRTFG